MLTMMIHKLKTNGINVDNNSINVDSNTQIEREIEREIETERETEINIYDLKSIYPSNHEAGQNKKLNDMMDEMEKMEFNILISNCEMHVLSEGLATEITEILKEMYMTPDTRNKIKEINSKQLLYALQNFTIANTKTKIQIPKQYFKKCVLSALEQTELSNQFDVNAIMSNISAEGG